MLDGQFLLECLPYAVVFSVLCIIGAVILMGVYQSMYFYGLQRAFWIVWFSIGIIYALIKPADYATRLRFEGGGVIPIAIFGCGYLLFEARCKAYARRYQDVYCPYIDEVIDHMPPPTTFEMSQIGIKLGIPSYIFEFDALSDFQRNSIMRKWRENQRKRLYDPIECLMMGKYGKPGRHYPWWRDKDSEN